MVRGYNTADWNGQVDAQGFVFNIDNVAEWTGTKEYSKGDIVVYKNQHYSAAERVPPSEKFAYNLWLETEYDEIKTGLLPNLSLKADQLRDYYDENVANLEQDADKLGFGIIGFNQREYLQNMNLDDLSQVNVYQNYIGTKGTKLAVDLFKSAKLEKELTDYEVYENWAVKQGVYGANENSSYVEFELDETLLSSNPATLKLIGDRSEETVADQVVVVDDLYKQSYKVDTTTLTTTYYSSIKDEISLPTAGYANTDDVDIQAFDLKDLGQLTLEIEDMKEGTTIWVAKDNSHEWNMYRVSSQQPTLTIVADNLDGTSTFTFNRPHELAKNDVIIIKFFETDITTVSYTHLTLPTILLV